MKITIKFYIFVVTRYHSLYHWLSFVVTRCHSLSLILPLVVPPVCLFINHLLKTFNFVKNTSSKLQELIFGLSDQKTSLNNKTRKTSGFKSLRVNSWEINHVTSKCQLDFLDKTCKIRSKTGKVNTTIEFYIFEIVLVPNFSLNWKFWIFGPN